jgi:hypothetical protein
VTKETDVNLPSHPDADDSTDAPDGDARTSWGGRIVVGAIIAVVVAVILLHLTGVVGPGAH